MSTPILATKLYIPTPRAKIVLRPRLIERLNEGLQRKLTLISASAGFGKTTLVSEWVNNLRFASDDLRLDSAKESKIVNRKEATSATAVSFFVFFSALVSYAPGWFSIRVSVIKERLLAEESSVVQLRTSSQCSWSSDTCRCSFRTS